MNKIKR